MSKTPTEAEALLAGDRGRLAELASRFIVPLGNNFVERPWGGLRMRDFKGLVPLPEQIRTSGLGLGECFEIAAYDDDAEAREHPSRIQLRDGSRLSLPLLLARHAEAIFGDEFVDRYGRCFPLLPKTLDVRELLSVQGHPAGNVEVYIVIAADEGASLGLGFKETVDAGDLKVRLKRGLEQQRALLELLPAPAEHELHTVLSAWFAEREAGVAALEQALGVAPDDRARAAGLLVELKQLYWRVLDSLNAIPVAAGQVIYNATPPRVLAEAGCEIGAEVHALGNPARREILALEIRRPGPTFRAWDNVRFPIRAVDVDAAVDALNLTATSPDEFIVEPRPVADRPATYVSVDCEFFRIEHLRPSAAEPVTVPAQAPHCLHALSGEASFVDKTGKDLGRLARGASAIVPAGVGAYRSSSAADGTEIVKVALPMGA